MPPKFVAVLGGVGNGAIPKTTKIKAHDTTVTLAQTSVAMRAQFFKRTSPTPLNTPKIPNASTQASMPSAIANVKWGIAGRVSLIGAISMPMRPIVAPSSTSTLPTIATTPDAVTEAEGFLKALTEFVYHFCRIAKRIPKHSRAKSFA
jgi:hypothetical protein